MLGLAKDLFKQSAVSLDDFSVSVKTDAPWPTIQTLLQAGYFAFVDYSFAKAVLQQARSSDEEEACFLAALMAISRLGHLCMTIEDDTITPSLDILTPLQAEKECDLSRLQSMVVAGAAKLSSKIVQREGSADHEQPIVADRAHYYLRKHYTAEIELSREMGRLLATPICPPSSPTLSPSLNDEQRAAVEKGLAAPLFLITGGPGTGKTYTAVHFLSAYLSLNPTHRVAIAAPTGKAISHLRTKILNAPELAPFHSQIEAGTLHSLLKIKRAEDISQRRAQLSFDCVVVDECSMIDLALFSALLAAIPRSGKLIMMGDDHQLPPVESGTVFAELAAFAEMARPDLIAPLHKCLRSEQREILSLSEDIRRGDRLNVQIALKANHCGAVTFSPLSFKTPLDAIIEEVNTFPSPTMEKPDAETLFSQIDAFRILTPLRKGPFGVETLNRQIWDRLFQKVKNNQYWAIPIIVTKTSYQLDLCNGEIGFLIRFLGRKGARDYALFADKQGKGYREIPAALLPSFHSAYALSVHKSQGSEYDRVALFLPPGSEHFGREVLYTGATRAKKSLHILADEETIERCLAKGSQRNSGMCARLLRLSEKAST